jgi:hypothetical protein
MNARLMSADFSARENFGLCFVQPGAEHSFDSSVLFTDEAHQHSGQKKILMV